MSSAHNKASEHLDRVSKGEDKNNAREFLNGKISINVSKNKTSIQIDGKSLELPRIRD